MGRLLSRPGRVIPGELLDARQQAEAMVAAARAEADALVAAARAEAEAIADEARRRGEAAGRADGEAAFTALLVAAGQEAERVRAAALPASRTLAVRMAEKIIGRAAALDPGVLAAIAGQALEAARPRGGVVLLRVHPDDVAGFEAARAALSADLPAPAVLSVVADPAIDRSGCVVETAAGRLDARLSTQLAALERAVFGAAGTTSVPGLPSVPRDRAGEGER